MPRFVIPGLENPGSSGFFNNMLFYRFVLFVFFFTLAQTARAGSLPVPWKDGEILIYEVHWGVFVAAEGTFQAKKDSNLWKISLDLKSRGVIDATVPIKSRMESDIMAETWRMNRFFADRHEGEKTKKYLVQMNPGQFDGTFRDLLKEDYKPKQFEVPAGDFDDILSFLYNLRRQDWESLKEKRWIVNDRWKVKQARAVFQALETIEDSSGVKRECQRLFVEELDEKGEPKNNGWMRIWITRDGERVPIKARVKMSFGTFTVLLKPGTVVSAGKLPQ